MELNIKIVLQDSKVFGLDVNSDKIKYMS